jgi:hypothetical protein
MIEAIGYMLIGAGFALLIKVCLAVCIAIEAKLMSKNS